MQTIKITRSPKLVYVGKLNAKPNWYFPSHKHEDISEMIYVVDGEGEFIIDEQSYHAQKGDLLIYNRGVIHEERSSENNPLVTYYCGVSHLQIEEFPDNFIIPKGAEPFFKQNKYSSQIESLFAILFQESTLKEAAHETISINLLNSIILLIQRIIQLAEQPAASEYDSLAIRIKEFLDKNYLIHMKLEDIAQAFHMNAYYISHVFKAKFQDSPINYLISRRMGEAKKLLINTEMKVQDIAILLGYENTNYFTRVFTKMIGETPLEFRKNERKERVNF